MELVQNTAAMPPCSLACSPRAGNSEYASTLFAKSFTDTVRAARNEGRNAEIGEKAKLERGKHCEGQSVAVGKTRGEKKDAIAMQTWRLRDYTILPCTACYACKKNPDHDCVLDPRDDAARLFALLLRAPALHFAAPIFFYHLPAQFKAFIDRGQRFWLLREAGHPSMQHVGQNLAAQTEQHVGKNAETTAPKRTAWVTLVAARKQGAQLFAGSLLSLKYFLQPFNIQLAEPLLLTGVDTPQDLAQSAELCARVQDYGCRAAQDFLQAQRQAAPYSISCNGTCNHAYSAACNSAKA